MPTRVVGFLPAGAGRVRGLVLAVCLLAGALPAAAEADPAPYGAVRADLRGAVAAATAGTLSRYRIEARLDPETGAVVGAERIAFVNTTGQTLREVYLRLYPNAPYYAEGAIKIRRLRAGGVRVRRPERELSVEDTVLRAPLPDPLPPGGTVELLVDFTTTVPLDNRGGFGILSRASDDGTWVLSDWYPILAGYDPARGWRLDPPVYADPTYGDPALYDVTLTAPAGLRLVAAGSEISAGGDGAREGEDAEGAQVRRYVAGPGRDFSLMAAPAGAEAATEVDGTTVRVSADPGEEALARATLETAAGALAEYSALFGAYPFAELDLAAAPLGALGVSWSGVIFLDEAAVGGTPAEGAAALTFLTAHEVGHQWWGGNVGSDSNVHTFLSEGLTNYLATVYLERTAGPAAAEATLRAQIAAPYLRLLAEHGDGIADLPADAPGPGRGTLIYGKAALGFLAIREAIGDRAFFAALRAYADAWSWRISAPADLLAAFEAASGADLDELWRVWFEAAETTAADVEALLA